MSGKGRRLTTEERRLWARVTRTVKAARPDEAETWREIMTAEMSVAAPPPSRGAVEVKEASGGPSRPLAPAPPRDMSHEKRVRRGRLDVEASLDLHGLTQDAAKHLLLRFIVECRQDGLRHVLVITGKGAASRDLAHPEWNREAPGVLKRRLPDWLGEPLFRVHVVAYAPAHRRHGGGGAFYLTLRRPA